MELNKTSKLARRIMGGLALLSTASYTASAALTGINCICKAKDVSDFNQLTVSCPFSAADGDNLAQMNCAGNVTEWHIQTVKCANGRFFPVVSHEESVSLEWTAPLNMHNSWINDSSAYGAYPNFSNCSKKEVYTPYPSDDGEWPSE